MFLERQNDEATGTTAPIEPAPERGRSRPLGALTAKDWLSPVAVVSSYGFALAAMTAGTCLATAGIWQPSEPMRILGLQWWGTVAALVANGCLLVYLGATALGASPGSSTRFPRVCALSMVPIGLVCALLAIALASGG